MQVICPKCSGNKTYRGMGSMTIKCEPCNGLGYIDKSTDNLPKGKTKNGKNGTEVIKSKNSEQKDTDI